MGLLRTFARLAVHPLPSRQKGKRAAAAMKRLSEADIQLPLRRMRS